MPEDLAFQVELAGRLVFAAVLGALIGIEREFHDHPAGMRTHLLVALGSAAFTVLSVEAFSTQRGDSGRVAAQVVTGIGFLGAGAILKEGATVRGLTTAASLWAVAAVGMAAGVGSWGVALAVTAIVIISLWPLRLVAERFIGRGTHRLVIRIDADGPSAVARAIEAIESQEVDIEHLESKRTDASRIQLDLDLRVADRGTKAALLGALAGVDGVRVATSSGGD